MCDASTAFDLDENEDGSERMYRAALAWRDEKNPPAIKRDWVPPRVLREYFPGGFYEQDKEGHPVWYDRAGQIDPKGILKHVSIEEVVKFGIWRAEEATKQHVDHSTVGHPGHAGKQISQTTCVQDLRGLGMRHANGTVLKVLKAIIATEDNYYPERLNKYLIINAPYVFSGIWKIVRAFVDPVTREKVHIVSGNAKDLLLKYIDKDKLPAYLGGEAAVDGDPQCRTVICAGGKVPAVLP